MHLKKILIKIHWILSTQIGLDPRIFIRSIISFPYYIKTYLFFRKNYHGKINFVPCLQDRFEESGSSRNEYFWQDLFVAQSIFKSSPNKHLDIGSRVDGFVAHIACFRSCEVLDVRSNTVPIPGVTFHQADLMDKNSINQFNEGYCDSISCLHAIEHFGLGRYGDPINPDGVKLGIQNISYLLKEEGIAYISTPVGEERVEFNANWVFDPKNILKLAKDEKLNLLHFYKISPMGVYKAEDIEIEFSNIVKQSYNLGLFIFQKKN